MARPPLASLVTRWAMNATRHGAEVPSRVLALLVVIAERTYHADRLARPGYATLKRDLGWSEDTIARTADEAARLGALDVRRFKGRGLAAEFRFTEAVYGAPNLDAFADLDRGKPRKSAALSTQENPANTPAKTPQIDLEKARTAAAPTVDATVNRTTEQPPLPPADAGGGRLTPKQIADQAADYVIARGDRAWPKVRRKLHGWARAGCSLDEIHAKIDQGDHLPPVKW